MAVRSHVFWKYLRDHDVQEKIYSLPEGVSRAVGEIDAVEGSRVNDWAAVRERLESPRLEVFTDSTDAWDQHLIGASGIGSADGVSGFNADFYSLGGGATVSART